MSTDEHSKYQVEASHYEDGGHPDLEKTTSNEITIQHAPEGTASASKALFMLLKAFIGTGVIFLPASFKNGGLALSIALMVILGLICLVAFHLLVIAQSAVGGSYGDIAYRLYGRYCRYVVLFFLCVSQIGFVSSYLMFVSQNIHLVAEALSGCNPPFESKYWIWIVLAIVIPICWVRKVARLSYAAVIADIFILFGLICILYYTGKEINANGPGPNIIIYNQKDFALMIGTATFSFEGIGMVISIVEGMKEPRKFPMVLNIGMAIVIGVMVLIGTLGYVAYGENIQASVVANLKTEPLSVTVQLLYAIAMILSSPFMLWPPLTIIERGIFGTKRSGQMKLKYKWGKNFVRALVACVPAAISFGVGSDNLDKFVSLVGIVACLPLCFIFPGMFHWKVTKNWWLRIVDAILIMWGSGILVYTLYVNISSWLEPSTSTPQVCHSLYE
ncbi:amino acid transporter [Lichtheimia corymbifera JMRC:FSU:9682]|uniref:Amino acid transporter n=1 Tax=Lichtheimia corymbifera JMRC:FSU:9682 TaxID=1263082 RepID=A0A068SDH0_9FUNG|nr:amino acid transporter [Lichtheimia corymbifera JMRC:FSU:9682]